MDNQDKIVKKSFLVSFAVLLGKLLGFIKQAVVAWAFGSNAITDIYFAADGYTSIIGHIMGQSVVPAVLTRYVKLEEEKEKKRALNLLKQSLVFFGFVGILLVLVNIVLSSKICEIIGVSYSTEQKIDLRFFVIMLCPVMFLSSLAGVAQGYLDAHKRFIPGKLFSLFLSISVIMGVLLFRNSLGLKSLLLGFLFGYTAYTFFMLCLMLPKVGVSFSNPFRNNDFKLMLKRFWPLIIGNSVVDLGLLIDKIVASSLVEGSVSALYYGQIISSDLINAVIITSVGTVLLTTFTKHISSHASVDEIVGNIQRVLCIMIMIMGLVSCIYVIEGKDIIKLFFERGNFDESNTLLVSQISFCYALGFIFLATREILIKVHYAFQDTLTPMINSIIGLATNIAASIVFSRFLGVAGVALATSLSMMIVAILSFFTLKKHLHRFPIEKKGLTDILKILVVIGFTVMIGLGIREVTSEMNLIMRLCIVSSAMGISYLIICFAVRERTLIDVVIPVIKKKK